ncbi:hypothetical protein PENSPDRAFT_752960 [Peniophora sp. CONT]|nr:hypothetical protein PENSPDRAFT_752960 [Peniophora sp. CONT]
MPHTYDDLSHRGLVENPTHILSNLAHKKTPATLFNALEATPDEQGAERTPTAHYAALLTTLDGTNGTCFSYVVRAHAGRAVELLNLTAPLFPALQPHPPTLRSQRGIYGSIFVSPDRNQLDLPAMHQSFASILQLCLDPRPKPARMRNSPRLLGLPSGTTFKPTYLVLDIESTADDDEPAPALAPVGQLVSAGKQRSKALPVPDIDVVDLPLSDDDSNERDYACYHRNQAGVFWPRFGSYVSSASIASLSRHYNLCRGLYARNGLKRACGALDQVILRPDAGLHRFKMATGFVNPDTRARKARRWGDSDSLMRGHWN